MAYSTLQAIPTDASAIESRVFLEHCGIKSFGKITQDNPLAQDIYHEI